MKIAITAVVAVLLLSQCSNGATGQSEPSRDSAAEGSEGTMIMLAGDVMLGRGIDQIMPLSVDPVIYEPYMTSALGYVEIAEEESGPIPRDVAPGYVWGDALEILDELEPSARIINLETAVTTADEPWPGKGIQYRMHPANVAVLEAAGIDCAVLSNNHVIDWGRRGLIETVESLREAGVKVAGAGFDLEDARGPVKLDDGVVVFAMAHESSGVPRAWAAASGTSGVHLLPDLSLETASDVATMIRQRSGSGDLVIVSIHWGGNWGYEVPREQELFAKRLIDEAGVDIVHGHSSHHPKGIELYEDRLIIYGAGDLINDYEGIGGHETFRPELSLLYLPTVDAQGALESMLLLPMRIEKFRLNNASAEEAQWLRDRLARESSGVRIASTSGGRLMATPE